jgi:hypothetical protein
MAKVLLQEAGRSLSGQWPDMGLASGLSFLAYRIWHPCADHCFHMQRTLGRAGEVSWLHRNIFGHNKSNQGMESNKRSGGVAINDARFEKLNGADFVIESKTPGGASEFRMYSEPNYWFTSLLWLL